MIAIIDYKAGNLTSVERAFHHIGAKCTVTSDPAVISTCDRIVFPGVGAAGAAMESIRRLGIDCALQDAFRAQKPILGICLGTQIIMEHSEENNTLCLGLVPGNVLSFEPDRPDADGNRLKIPHMGWNTVDVQKPHPLLNHITPQDTFYFVHGYYPAPTNPAHILATTEYGVQFASTLGFKNLVATQFHPEKSGEVGLAMLRNFLTWSSETD